MDKTTKEFLLVFSGMIIFLFVSYACIEKSFADTLSPGRVETNSVRRYGNVENKASIYERGYTDGYRGCVGDLANKLIYNKEADICYSVGDLTRTIDKLKDNVRH